MTEKSPLIEYLDRDAAVTRVDRVGAELGVDEYAVVRNLGYVLAPVEVYPLAPRTPAPLNRIVAFAVDMDGTSTTTEPLALHGLEQMVRRFTGLATPDAWAGLDEEKDYPYVIGNSNFRHTEFLLNRYGDRIDPAAFCAAFIETVVWTLASMSDPGRRRDVRLNARNSGLGSMLDDAEFQAAVAAGPCGEDEAARRARPLVERFGAAFHPHNDAERTAAALDLYYQRYHAILGRMERGEGDALAERLVGPGRRLVEPMPGYGIFLATIKGWLGADAGAVAEMLIAAAADTGPGFDPPPVAESAARLRRLGRWFAERPARVALVTASIGYETRAVMKEILRLVRSEASSWPVSTETRDRIDRALADELDVFDGFVTATDAHEARLKPHRDLYTMALYQMAVPPRDYRWCVGIEDTEPGIVSLRAAGFGIAVALPNRDTRGQDYRAATHCVRHGLPELLLRHALFLE